MERREGAASVDAQAGECAGGVYGEFTDVAKIKGNTDTWMARVAIAVAVVVARLVDVERGDTAVIEDADLLLQAVH